MTFVRSFLRHTMLWSLPGGEVANCTVAWADTGGIVSLDTATVNMLAAKGLALWTTIKPYYSPPVTYNGSRVAWIGVNGRTIQTAERTITAVPGTGGGNSLPQEVAVCASLRTATYSRAGRGRIYLPNPGTNNVLSSARFDAGAAAVFAGGMQTYLGSSTSPALKSYVASGSTGNLYLVTDVRIGDVFDVQRRRRDSLQEVYVTQPVT